MGTVKLNRYFLSVDNFLETSDGARLNVLPLSVADMEACHAVVHDPRQYPCASTKLNGYCPVTFELVESNREFKVSHGTQGEIIYY